jgi:sigma-B regulation protein RsbU (phosphoserine phosphatase)
MSTPNRQSACVPFFAPPTAENPALAFEPAPGTDSRSIPGLDYYGACRSANNSTGDFFKFIPLDGRRLLASIGETPGPGMSPRAMMTAVQAHFPGVAASGPDSLAAAASRLNRALCDVASDGSLTTLFCACIDPLRRVLRYLSAGHESALLFRATHFSAHRLEPTGTVLGLTSRTVYRQRSVGLSPGDVLIAFTGGVADAVDRAGRVLGEAGVIEALRDSPDNPPRILVERILDTVARYGEGAGQPADQTVLAVRFAGSEGSLNEGHAAKVALAAA